VPLMTPQAERQSTIDQTADVTPFLTLVAAKSMLTVGEYRRGRGRPRMHIEVETQNIDGEVTALGSAGPFTLVVDRPAEGGGGGLGSNGGQLLYLAVAGCISNGLFRDARADGIELSRVRVKVSGDFVGEPAVSKEVHYEVEVSGDAPEEQLRALVDRVDEIAEIPNSLRQGTRVSLVGAKVR
jgi:putative redox protein